ncbi:MAG: type II secretion system minor pseudopilin GspI [Gammaproteobacteria bacterium]|nr:type II secretion system minor pseudopilin GspI [Gammaproteobacteria bacterium]
MKQRGFTLIEVLLALMIIAIGMTALLKSSAQNIQSTQRLKDKSLQRLVAMTAMADLQMHVLGTTSNREITQTTSLFGHTWYWRAQITPTRVKFMQQISISASPKRTGPFTNHMIGYRLLI